MTPTDVYKFMDEAFPGAVKSTPYGIEWGPLRIERGSGIAGRGDIWAITFPGNPDVEPICGLRTKRDLKIALRGLIIDLVERGQAILRAIARPEFFNIVDPDNQ